VDIAFARPESDCECHHVPSGTELIWGCYSMKLYKLKQSKSPMAVGASAKLWWEIARNTLCIST
jgi:hypothetical protein